MNRQNDFNTLHMYWAFAYLFIYFWRQQPTTTLSLLRYIASYTRCVCVCVLVCIDRTYFSAGFLLPLSHFSEIRILSLNVLRWTWTHWIRHEEIEHFSKKKKWFLSLLFIHKWAWIAFDVLCSSRCFLLWHLSSIPKRIKRKRIKEMNK